VRSAEIGSGSILAVGILGGMLALTALLFPLAGVLTARHRVAAAADVAALAGADVVAGIFPGVPCEAAARLTRAAEADLAACQVDGAVITVRAETKVFGFIVAATATAGPSGARDR
jgi:secretion/DNA translocation related TadE-like protein